VEHVRPAVLGAQRVVLGAAIEHDRTRRLGENRDGKKIVGEEVGDEEALTVREALLDRSHHVAIRGHDQLGQGIVMAKKAAGRLIVRECQRGAGQALVLELTGLKQRGRRQLGRVLARHVGDRHREPVGRRCGSRRPQPHKQGKQGGEPAGGLLDKSARRHRCPRLPGAPRRLPPTRGSKPLFGLKAIQGAGARNRLIGI
jgi:hypothetical protein